MFKPFLSKHWRGHPPAFSDIIHHSGMDVQRERECRKSRLSLPWWQAITVAPPDRQKRERKRNTSSQWTNYLLPATTTFTHTNGFALPSVLIQCPYPVSLPCVSCAELGKGVCVEGEMVDNKQQWWDCAARDFYSRDQRMDSTEVDICRREWIHRSWVRVH